MSRDTAVGAVSRTLHTLLADRLEPPPGGTGDPVIVTVGPPPDAEAVNKALVNLFLFRVSENGALKNQHPPGRVEPGGSGRPPLALDLHYLVTAYGLSKIPADDEFKHEVLAHYLLGNAMRILHEYAIITPSLRMTNGTDQVLDADLVDARERIKITLQPISLEDISKVWTALTRPFRAAAVYQVTVVQIDPRLRDPAAQPVGEDGPDSGRRVRAVRGATPIITAVYAVGRSGGTVRTGAQVRAGETLVLEGEGFVGENTEVSLGGIAGLGQISSVRDDRMTVVVPRDPRLQPGIISLQISHGIAGPTPADRRTTFTSGVTAFALVPEVTHVGIAPVSGELTIDGHQLVVAGQESVVLVGAKTIERSQFTTATPEQIRAPLPTGLTSGQRVRVFVRANGVQSIDATSVTP